MAWFLGLSVWVSISTCDESILQAQRFLKPLAVVRSVLEKDEATLCDRVLEHDLRNHVFRLEALGKVYVKIYEREEFETFHKMVQDLEDAIGAMSGAEEKLSFNRQLGAEQKVIEDLEKKERAARETFLNFLKNQGWTAPQKTRGAIAEAWVRSVDWTLTEDDRSAVATVMIKQLKKLRALDFDLDQLENGIHEMRRRLRWMMLDILALDGLVIVEGLSVPDRLQRFTRVKFNLPFNPSVKNPLVLKQADYQELAQAVRDLGDIKDLGESLEALAESYLDTGLEKAREKAYARAVALAESKGFDCQLTARAQVVRTRLVTTKVLEKIENDLQRQIK